MTVEFKYDKRFAKKAKGMIGKYQFQVGVLQDRPHMSPGNGTKSYAGGPARKISNKTSGLNISDVSERVRKNTGINFYKRPFTNKRNKDILKFAQEFTKVIFGKSQPKRAENLLQAIIRNPILRGDYGKNSSVTQKIKGFNRFMIDTAQLFKNIIAKVKVKNG